MRSQRGLLNTNARKIAAATGLFGCLAFAALGAVATNTPAAAADTKNTAAVTTNDRGGAAAAANRSTQRVAPAAKAATTAKPAAKAAAKPAAAPVVKTVAGLDETQTKNARAIIEAGKDMNLPKKAMVIALSTSMQESNLYNLASTVLPESTAVAHEGVGSDHDSVGLFQQRSTSGWGPVDKLMQPKFAATQFYKGLVQVNDWQDMPVTEAAQTVQVSAYPDAYAKHEFKATEVVNGLY
jgi:hypothetical protein